jgi:hypothetical protein
MRDWALTFHTPQISKNKTIFTLGTNDYPADEEQLYNIVNMMLVPT